MAGGGADAAVRWRDVGMTGQHKTGSGKRYDIGLLFIGSGFCQSSARSSEIAARVPAHTSADVKFRALTSVHRGRSEIDEGRQMGKPRSNGWREAESAGRYGRAEAIK